MREPDTYVRRAVAYVRVSMAREDMISPELQMLAITDYCSRRGYKIIKTLEDLDLSGRFWNRRQVELAVRMIEQDEADVLVVWRWSRVSRNRLDWALAVDRVEKVGGCLESATEGFDTTTATGRFARGMVAEFAAYESDRMGDIWREVRERRLRMGLTATGQEQFGYVKVHGRYLVDRKLAPILAQVYRRYISGESCRSLSAWLTKRGYHTAHPHKPGLGWSRQNLQMMLDRGFAAGYVIADGEFVPGAHTPLITEQEWHAYQRRRASTRWHKRTTLDPFLLDGLLYCACGTRMGTAQASRTTKAKYKCHSHNGGTTKTIYQARVDPIVHEWVIRLASDLETAAAAAEASRAFTRGRWLESRRLAGERGTCAPEKRAALVAEIAKAEHGAHLPDPTDLAQALCEDWDGLTIDRRQDKLRDLISRIALDTTYTTLVLTITTVWGTDERFAGLPRVIREMAPPRQSTPPVEPTSSATDPAQFLTTTEAAKVLGVNRTTVSQWRRLGLLPDSLLTLDGSFLHSLNDLRRILAAPACTNGRSRTAIRESIAVARPATASATAAVPHDPNLAREG